MARRTAGRLVVEGTLRCTSALHVGGAVAGLDVDLALAEDGAGNYYVPGTSLAGALRAWLTERSIGLIDSLFGPIQTQDGVTGAASLLLIGDAPVTLPDGAVVESRDGVGIDRVTGAAATGIKYDRAVLPRGSTMRVRLELEEPFEAATEHRELLGTLIAALCGGEVALGAARTRGLGRVVLTDVRLRRYPLMTRADLLLTLRGGEEIDPGDLGRANVETLPALEIEVVWRPLAPVMMRADGDGIVVDALPLVGHVEGGRLALLLQGSGVKGVLRSHAEWILRTVLGCPAPAREDGTRRFLDQLEQFELVNWLFGAVPEKQEGDVAKDTLLRGRGAVSVEDTYATHKIEVEDWEAITARGPERKKQAQDDDEEEEDEIAAERYLREKLEAAGLGDWSGAHHVAVDRWTGGAADQRLFSVLEPHEVEWGPVRLSLAFNRIPKEWHQAATALLLLVLRDLAAGLVPLGYGTHRGHGAIAVDRVTVTGVGLDNGIGWLQGDHDLAGLDLQRLRDGWEQYLDGAAGSTS